jgi:hypothetical protein
MEDDGGSCGFISEFSNTMLTECGALELPKWNRNRDVEKEFVVMK